MEKKPKMTKTQKRLAGWKFLKGFMHGSKYVVAETPVTVMTIVQHKEWFEKSATQSASISTGLAIFILVVLGSVICIVKKEQTYKKISPFITAAIYLIIFGMIGLFMASVWRDLAWTCIYTGAGMVAAVVEDTVEKNAVQGKVDYWNGVLSDAGMNQKENKEKQKRKADVRRAKAEAQQAIE